MTSPDHLRVRHAFAFVFSALVLSVSAAADPIGQTTAWTANPNTVVQGKTSEVILTAPAATCGTQGDQLKDADLVSTTTPPSIHVQAGFDVTAGTPTKSGTCELTVPLNVAKDAKTGPLRLTIKGAGATAGPQDLGYSTVTIASSQAGPIPDGLSQQVDLSYKVLGYQQVYDNFGRRVADNYFAVQITIGNNTGFPLQLSGAAFQINSEDTPSPTDNIAIVQGSLLYGQDYSARNIIYRSLVWAALIGAGANPYFHSANAKANYSAALALFSGPFVNGFLQQFPDNTVKQLGRLGSSDVMTDQNVIPNNTPLPFIAFLSRDSVCPPGGTDPVHTSSFCGSVNFHKFYRKHTFYNPESVKSRLGEVTIVGKLLPNFAPRIKVTAITSTGTPPTAGTADGPVVVAVQTEIGLESTGLTGATVSSAPTGVTATAATDKPSTDSTFYVSVLTPASSASPIPIVLQRKDTSKVTFPVTVQQPVLTVSLPSGMTALPINTATQVKIVWKAGGPDLSTANIGQMAQADGTSSAVGTPTATAITATITPKRAGTLQIPVTLKVKGTNFTDFAQPTVTAQ